jgi:hypothetical protein
MKSRAMVSGIMNRRQCAGLADAKSAGKIRRQRAGRLPAPRPDGTKRCPPVCRGWVGAERSRIGERRANGQRAVGVSTRAEEFHRRPKQTRRLRRRAFRPQGLDLKKRCIGIIRGIAIQGRADLIQSRHRHRRGPVLARPPQSCPPPRPSGGSGKYDPGVSKAGS